MSKKILKKVFIVAAVVLFGVLLLQPAFVSAQGVVPPTNTAAPTGPSAAAKGEPSQVSCGWDVFCHLIKAFNELTLQIGYAIGYVAAFLVSIAVTIIQVIINAGAQITSSPLVLKGFGIALDIANLGFVLAIIVIAYATIFRVSGYETKKLLKNLIIAALLVNFSFSIAGLIIDAGNVFGNFFLQAVSPKGIVEFGDNLANSLSVQKLSGLEIGVGKGFVGSVLDNFRGWLMAFASLSATAIFSVILVITFFAVAFMLLIRYLYITFLLIIMPLAWLMWIFPGFSKHWSAWWSSFVRWNLFYPAVAFFLYLSIFTSQELGKKMSEFGFNTKALEGAEALTGLGTATLLGFIQIIVQVGIVFGGLIVANKLGIDGSAGALKMASNVKNWALGATGKAMYKATGAQMLTNRMLQKGGLAEKIAGGLSKAPVLRNLPFAQTTAAGLYNLAAARQKAVGQQQEYLSKDSDGALLAKFNQLTTDKVRKAALVNEVAKRGLTDKVDEKRLESYLGDAKDMGATKGILENAPQLAPHVADRAKLAEEIKKARPNLAGAELEVEIDRKAVQTAMDKFRPGNTEKLPVSAFKDIKVVVGLKKAHLERLAKEGTEEQRVEIIRTARRELPENDSNRSFLEANPMMQSAIETVEKEVVRAYVEEKLKKQP